MKTLKEKNIDLIAELRATNVPDTRSMKILLYAQAARSDKQIGLYEEYLLVSEALAFERQSYIQAAWDRKVYIMHLLPLLNMRMMALLFQEEAAAKKWEAGGMETYRLNRENRPHYILDKYPSFLHGENDPVLLNELLKVRDSRSRPFPKGPYHDEYFPYNPCRYEERLLGKDLFTPGEKFVRSEIEDILVELYIIQNE